MECSCRGRGGEAGPHPLELRTSMPGAHVQEEVGTQDERLVEDDGAEPGDRTDHDAKNAPLGEVGSRADHIRAAALSARAHTAGRGVAVRRVHRSQPALQSCSEYFPSDLGQLRERGHHRALGLERNRRRCDSRRRRTVTASMSSRPVSAAARCIPNQRPARRRINPLL